MMSLWESHKISSFAKVVGGGTPDTKNSRYWEGDVPWIAPSDLTGYTNVYISLGAKSITSEGLKSSSAKILPAETVLVSSRAPVGYLAIAKNPLCTNQGFRSLVIDIKKADPRFIYYSLMVYKGTLEAFASGATFPELSGSSFKRIEIPLPGLSEQKRISSILFAYDDLIENNNKRITILEQMAEQIYMEWFVRMRFPGYENTEFEKGVPKGWEISDLGSIASITMGQSPKSEFYNLDGIGLPFHQGVGSYGKRFPQHDTFCSVNGRQAKEGDILFSVRAPVGRLNIADKQLIIGRGLGSIRHKSGLQSYLFYLLNYYFQLEDIIGNGAVFNSVGKDELNRFKILKPDNNLDNQFNDLINPIDKEISVIYKQVQILKQTRDLLLPRLISGKLRVKDVDKLPET